MFSNYQKRYHIDILKNLVLEIILGRYLNVPWRFSKNDDFLLEVSFNFHLYVKFKLLVHKHKLEDSTCRNYVYI